MPNDEVTAASNEVAAVIQADRENAAQFIYPLGSGAVPTDLADLAHNIRRGRADDNRTVQAFARHRIAHSDPRPVAEDLRGAAMDALGFDPNDFVEEARGHLADMPKCIQRDYLRLALEKIEAVTAALATHSPAPMAGEGWHSMDSAPLDKTEVLLTNGAVVTPAKWLNDRWTAPGYAGNNIQFHPTGWMHFPAAAHPSTQEG